MKQLVVKDKMGGCQIATTTRDNSKSVTAKISGSA